MEKCKAEAEIVKVRVSKDIQPQDHVCMEPVSAIGYAKDGRVTVYACTQAPFEVRRMLAKNLAMDEENIRVVATPLGGGFRQEMRLVPRSTRRRSRRSAAISLSR